MHRRTVGIVVLVLVAQLALVGSSGRLTSSASAQGGMPGDMSGAASPNGQPPMQMGSTTRAQREAAAARAAAARAAVATNAAAAAGASPLDSAINWFVCLINGTQPSNANGAMPMTSGSAAPAAVGPTPDYFGTVPNFANSPLPPNVVISDSSGTGAEAIATVQTVIGASGQITRGVVTAITVLNPGTGYSANATITISPTTNLAGLSGDGDGATAQATIDPANGAITAITVTNGGSNYSGIRKFVTKLPGLTAANANEIGQYIPVAIADTTTYPGADYYEIDLVEYSEQVHPDLPPTKLRGYVQFNTRDATVSKPNVLGPTIVAQRDRPVRIKFTNKLPTGSGGDLFIPVDTTVMGAGTGPFGGTELYPQNRAGLHLHGGMTPWISDGTPHQWTTPVGQTTAYPKGVSVQNVPDMPDPGPGAMTFFYTNQQSARLLFYHDHSYGLTRLNVYAGEAGGYLLRDTVEQALVANHTIPADEIPLVIQDKTFVPGPQQLAGTDPSWNTVTANKAPLGSLWLPHVYMPNQNPADLEGTNAMGRWDYGAWFWPPYTGLVHKPMANPYAVPGTSEGPEIPATPDPSIVPEGFMDTPLVNGTPYPYLPVEQKAYRFRILNASNDRFLNLQLYLAKSNNPLWDANGNLSNPDAGEVAMVDAIKHTSDPAGWPTDGREGGVPDPASRGPALVQIGTEGGFLPNAVVLNSQPINYDYNRRSITVLNITQKTLFLGPAERADVIVDFSLLPPGTQLILYNDAPAPVPAFDSRNDYYTGDPDQRSTGGAPTTLAGYGPNTRTIMQFRVTAPSGPVTPFSLANLQAAIPAAFAQSQAPIIVPQPAYNAAYGQSFANNYVRIQDTAITFTPAGSTTPLTINMAPKAIQELFEVEYGRMNSTLGVEVPNTNATIQTTIPYGFIDPATETIQDSITPLAPAAGDGTQIWKITHNGVDTHAIHFHLFDVQLVNRVGWDGQVKPPDANELGWKDTVRMNPLEDAIVALRPIAPKTPFGLADSIRPLDVTAPLGSLMGFTNVDPNGNPVTVVNQVVNYGNEYVWHCHLLGHEENDMMRSIVFKVTKTVPDAPILTVAGASGSSVLTWNDATLPSPTFGQAGTNWGNPKNEIGFEVQRATIGQNGQANAYTLLGTALANTTTYTDSTGAANGTYSYKLIAYNAAGRIASNTVTVGPAIVGTPPKAPSQLQTLNITRASITLSWKDNANNEQGFAIERSLNGRTWTRIATTGANVRTYVDNGLTRNTAYWYRVQAFNLAGASAYAGPVTATTLLR